MPWFGLQYVIVVFPDHSHLLFSLEEKSVKTTVSSSMSTTSSSLCDKQNGFFLFLVSPKFFFTFSGVVFFVYSVVVSSVIVLLSSVCCFVASAWFSSTCICYYIIKLHILFRVTGNEMFCSHFILRVFFSSLQDVHCLQLAGWSSEQFTHLAGLWYWPNGQCSCILQLTSIACQPHLFS